MDFGIRAEFSALCLRVTILLAAATLACGKPAPPGVEDFFRDSAAAARLQPLKAIPDEEQVPPDWVISRDDAYDAVIARVELPSGGVWDVALNLGSFSPALWAQEGLAWGLHSMVEPRYLAWRTMNGELWIRCDLSGSGMPPVLGVADLIRRGVIDSEEEFLQEILPKRSALFRQILAIKSE